MNQTTLKKLLDRAPGLSTIRANIELFIKAKHELALEEVDIAQRLARTYEEQYLPSKAWQLLSLQVSKNTKREKGIPGQINLLEYLLLIGIRQATNGNDVRQLGHIICVDMPEENPLKEKSNNELDAIMKEIMEIFPQFELMVSGSTDGSTVFSGRFFFTRKFEVKKPAF